MPVDSAALGHGFVRIRSRELNWITRHYGTGPEGFHAWSKWLLGTHRIGQYEHMKPEYQHRLPEIEANYQEWAAKIGW